jgi:hypothetical protein
MTQLWPDDADGDVLRRLKARAFNFEAIYDIEFVVDFDDWPPAPQFVDFLKAAYPRLELYGAADGRSGYVKLIVESRLTYDLVISMQQSISEMAKSRVDGANRGGCFIEEGPTSRSTVRRLPRRR